MSEVLLVMDNTFSPGLRCLSEESSDKFSFLWKCVPQHCGQWNGTRVCIEGGSSSGQPLVLTLKLQQYLGLGTWVPGWGQATRVGQTFQAAPLADSLMHSSISPNPTLSDLSLNQQPQPTCNNIQPSPPHHIHHRSSRLSNYFAKNSSR